MTKVISTFFYSLCLAILSMLACSDNNAYLTKNETEQTISIPKSTNKTADSLATNYLIENISVSKKITQIPPYIMYAYGFSTSFSSEQYGANIYTTAYEDMDYDNERLIFGVIFISLGDLQEEPLTLYIHGKRNPDMLSPPSFCNFDTGDENKLIIYASHTCNAKQPPESETLTIILNPNNSKISVEGKELHALDL